MKAVARGLVKVGDSLVPGGDGFPSFAESGATGRLATFLSYIPDGDRQGLEALLKFLGFLPRWMVRIFLWKMGKLSTVPGILGAPFRLVVIGLKGAVYTLYYDEPGIQGRLGWDAKVIVRERKKG